MPPHLRMRFLVEDEAGRPLAAGRDLRALQEQLAERAEAGLAVAASTFERDGAAHLGGIGTLPREVDVTWAGFRRRAYPALVDQGDSVAVRVFPTPEEQGREMWAGTRRLLLLSLPNPTRAAERRLSNDTQLALARSPYPKVADLFDDCVLCAVDQLLGDLGGPVWTEQAFTGLRTGVSHALTESVVYVVTVVAGILAIANGIELQLGKLRAPSLAPSIDDIERQLAGLVGPGFVAATGVRRLPDLLRYLEGIELRLDKLPDRRRPRLRQPPAGAAPGAPLRRAAGSARAQRRRGRRGHPLDDRGAADQLLRPGLGHGAAGQREADPAGDRPVVVGGRLTAPRVVTIRTAMTNTASPARKSRAMKVFWKALKSLGDTVVKCPMPISPLTE